MPRPKNEAAGKPTRNRRIHVLLTDEEHERIADAAEKAGAGVSTYIRVQALKAARDEG